MRQVNELYKSRLNKTTNRITRRCRAMGFNRVEEKKSSVASRSEWSYGVFGK